MATSVRSRRRPVRSVTQVQRSVTEPSWTARFARLATSRPALTAYVVIGTTGLVALAIALVGPRKIDRQVLKPLRSAIEPQAERLWAESRPLREQIAGLFRAASPSGRERLVRSFQSWIGHFHAT